MKDEELMVYLSAANEAVSAVLLVERNRRQMSIHYVSRSLQGAEVNYAPIEKLDLALAHAARRLKRYFQGHTIKVITDKPINQILNSREASRRLAKWAVELGAYGITGSSRSKKFSEQNEASESSKIKEEQPAVVPTDEADTWKLYTNGVSIDHGSGAGLILIDPEGVKYSYALWLNFSNSNNDAEYEALLAGLRITTGMKVEKMHAFVDSKRFDKFWISHIPREENKKVDALSKLASVQCEGLTKGVLVEELDLPPNTDYMEKGTLPEDAIEARTIREKVNNYVIEDGKNQPKHNARDQDEAAPGRGREIAIIREARQKKQVEKYYNQRVHHKQFRTGEFILQKNKVSKAENTGKLGPKWEGPYEVVKAYGTGAYKLKTMDEAKVPRTWHLSNL
nr:hypothetical protein [Tanacetum cinerariifolium]